MTEPQLSELEQRPRPFKGFLDATVEIVVFAILIIIFLFFLGLGNTGPQLTEEQNRALILEAQETQ